MGCESKVNELRPTLELVRTYKSKVQINGVNLIYYGCNNYIIMVINNNIIVR